VNVASAPLDAFIDSLASSHEPRVYPVIVTA